MTFAEISALNYAVEDLLHEGSEVGFRMSFGAASLARAECRSAGRNVKKRLERVRELASIAWRHDCMRHSLVSYALPVWGSMKVANWSGHSEAVLHQHYRELVEPHEAERFWAVMPPLKRQ